MTWEECSNLAIDNAKDVASIQCLEPIFANVVRAVIAFSGVGLFIMLLSAGFRFLFSSGDQKKLEQARGTMTNAIVGLVIIISAYLILKTIGVFTGVEVTTFSIPTQ